MPNKHRELYEFADYRLDIQERILCRSGKRIPLTEKTFDTLCILVKRGGELVGKDELMAGVWPESIVEENNLDQKISVLRQALRRNNKQGEKFIETVRGHGYRFVADVRRIEEDESEKKKVEKEKTTAGLQGIIDEANSRTDETTDNFTGQVKQGRRPAAMLMAVFFVAAGALGYYFWPENKPLSADGKRSVAVLPFVNLSQDPNADYLSDGITETINNNLSRLTGLRVMSRNSAFRFKNNQIDIKNIASQLGVEALVTGDIREFDNKFIINVRLIDASDESQIWGHQYVKDSSDILAVQNDIAQAVVNNLHVKLTNSEQQHLTKRPTENIEAWQLYQRGRLHVFRLKPSDIETGISYFIQAIEIDPDYARAYVGLAEAYRSLTLSAEIVPRENLPKARAAAKRAVEIDDTFSEAHTALGSIHFWEWNWSEAEKQYRRALEINPNNGDARILYAHLLSATGRHSDALIEARRARELDPLFPYVNALEGQFLLHAGYVDEGLYRLQQTFDLAPNFWLPYLFASSAYIEKGNFPEAIEQAQKAKNLSGVSTHPDAFAGYALAKSGKRDEAEAVLNDLLKLSTARFVSPFHIALIYNGLDETEKTLEWLEKAYEQHDPKMVFLMTEPKWNNLRNEPRFIDLLRRMNLAG